MQELLSSEAPEPAQGQVPDALPRLRLTSARTTLPIALAITALSGALLSLSLPPADLGPVAFVGLIPFLWLVRVARPWRGALLGLVFGFAYFGAVLYWILLFGEMAWLALSLGSAAFIAAFGVLAPAVWRAERPVRSAFGLAALWTGIEWLRSMWPIGGFTWGGLGYTQVDNPLLVPIASVTGVWGVTFVVLLVNALLLVAIDAWRGRRGARPALIPVAMSIAAILAPGLIAIPAPEGRELDVASIQVDVRPAARGSGSLTEDRAVALLIARLHQRLAPDPPGLAIWGESALDPGAREPTTWANVTGAIEAVGAPTLAGAVTVARDGRAYNQSLLFDGHGRVIMRYSKVHLVPFGEYVPWRTYVGWISALEQIPYELTPGGSLHTLEVDGIRFGNVICFENSFPSIDRKLVSQGAGFLVVTTNNASYELTAASRQHLVMSRLRAVENARWVVHAAVSGISAFIDPTGRVVEQAGLFKPAIIRQAIRASGTRTLYTRFGDWLPWASLATAAGLILQPRRRRSVRPVGELPNQARTLVVLPTYQERATIGKVIGGLLRLPDQVDVLVVDDGSPDGTAEVVEEIARREPRVRLLERPSKQGLASAYLTGFRRALDEGYDLVVEMDADLSHLPDELPGLLGAARGLDLAIGSRYVPGGSVTNWGRGRLALSRAGNLYARLALGFGLRDATSGYRVYRRSVLQELLRKPVRSDGYGFQIEMALRAWKAGYAVGETPITFREREHGRSKISRGIVFEALWMVTVWGFRERFRAGTTSVHRP